MTPPSPIKAADLPAWLNPGDIDTVLVAFPDVYGRLLGKRFTCEHFLARVLSGGMHVCNYLLTVDLEMNPQAGFALASWDRGYGDFHVALDLATLRRVPWSPGAAMVLGDLHHPDGGEVAEAPRTLLRRQVARLAERDLCAQMASELEFYLYRETYRSAREAGYRELDTASDYLIDYHLLQPSRDEDVLARARQEMSAAGIPVEGSKGEWGKGQHEVNLVYCEALEMADRHALFKHGLKEIAAQQGRSVTFMAKPYAEVAGSSCHVHASLWDRAVNANRLSDGAQPGALFSQFLGGLLRYAAELSYFFAPTVNSYKRYQAASWAPTSLVWAHDNRTTGFRVLGSGPSLRIENRMPGADVNPYLAFAATIAAGLRGIDEGLDCGPAYHGNAYADPTLPRLPASLEEAVSLLEQSAFAREALGSETVDYYVHTGRLEAEAFRREVTDWERARYFEQI